MTAETLVAPAADDAVVTYLTAEVAPAGCGIKLPTALPSGGYLVVTLTGGPGRRNVVLHEAQVTLDAWHSTDEGASDLIMLADGLMHAARFSGTPIRGATSLSAPTSTPDPTTGTPRRRATYIVLLRASAQ